MPTPLLTRDRRAPRWDHVGWSLFVIGCAVDAGAALMGAPMGGALWAAVSAVLHEGTQAAVLAVWPLPGTAGTVAPSVRVDIVIGASVLLTLLAPAIGAGWALHRCRQATSAWASSWPVLMARWAAATYGQTATYIADATTQQLPLLRSAWSLPVHDWAYLLPRYGGLAMATTARSLVRGVGALWWLAAVSLGVRALWSAPKHHAAPPDATS